MKEKGFTIRIDEETLDKIRVVAEYNGRSMNSEMVRVLREHIKKFEKEVDKIELDEKK